MKQELLESPMWRHTQKLRLVYQWMDSLSFEFRRNGSLSSRKLLFCPSSIFNSVCLLTEFNLGVEFSFLCRAELKKESRRLMKEIRDSKAEKLKPKEQKGSGTVVFHFLCTSPKQNRTQCVKTGLLAIVLCAVEWGFQDFPASLQCFDQQIVNFFKHRRRVRRRTGVKWTCGGLQGTEEEVCQEAEDDREKGKWPRGSNTGHAGQVSGEKQKQKLEALLRRRAVVITLLHSSSTQGTPPPRSAASTLTNALVVKLIHGCGVLKRQSTACYP